MTKLNAEKSGTPLRELLAVERQSLQQEKWRRVEFGYALFACNFCLGRVRDRRYRCFTCDENYPSYVRGRTEWIQLNADNFGKIREGLQPAGWDRLSAPAPTLI